MTRKRIFTILLVLAVSLIIGIAFSTTTVNHLLELKDVFFRLRGLEELQEPAQILYFTIFTFLISLVIGYLLNHFIWSYISRYSIRKIAIWITSALTAGIILVIISPGRVPLPPAWHILEITALGEKDSRSNGTEVWLSEIRILDQDPLPFAMLEGSANWLMEDRELPYLVSTGLQPATLRHSFQGGKIVPKQSVKVLLRSTSSSGLVRLRLDDEEQIINLYEQDEGDSLRTLYIATYDKTNPHNQSFLIKRLILYIADIITVSSLIHYRLNPI